MKRVTLLKGGKKCLSSNRCMSEKDQQLERAVVVTTVGLVRDCKYLYETNHTGTDTSNQNVLDPSAICAGPF